MDSDDDDYEIFAPPQHPSPTSFTVPKFNRLKKSAGVPKGTAIAAPTDVVIDAMRLIEDVDVGEANRSRSGLDEAEEVRSEDSEEVGEKRVSDLECGDLESDESGKLVDESECVAVMEMNHKSEGSVEENLNEFWAKRTLDFDSVEMDGEAGMKDLGVEDSEKKSDVLEGVKVMKKKRKKRSSKGCGGDDDDGGDGEDLECGKAVSKRGSEKERREYLNQLHAESQRLLRETRDAGFKPTPPVRKPISSVLEKIRKRKLEVQKKFMSLGSSSYTIYDDDDDSFSSDDVMNLIKKGIPLGDNRDAGLSKKLIDDLVGDAPEVECVTTKAFLVNTKELLNKHNPENNDLLPNTDEEPKSSLRAPVCDTEDFFRDSEKSDLKNATAGGENEEESAIDKNRVPSVLAINLQFDSAPLDDEFSDEEDNDKENVSPHPPVTTGNRVQAFVDDEAIDEDESDNELRSLDNEDDDSLDDAEEFNDMIATNYEENQIDHDRRQELHRKMLEQQDEAGIDDLLQKYRCAPKSSEPIMLEHDDIMEEDEDISGDENEAPKNSLRQCAKKAKQMIVHMFTDNDEVYVSSEDEELHAKVVKQRAIRKLDKPKKLLPPVEDVSSKEVFGLIKKLNIASEIKKKAKISSFDLMTSKSISSTKSSFLGRTSSNSLASSGKHRSGATCAYVFARDDSNSRSSTAASEDSVKVEIDVQQKKRPAPKFSQLQSKEESNDTKESVSRSGSSLFEVLRRSSVEHDSQDTRVGSYQSVFASFKLPKRSKIEGRS